MRAGYDPGGGTQLDRLGDGAWPAANPPGSYSGCRRRRAPNTIMSAAAAPRITNNTSSPMPIARSRLVLAPMDTSATTPGLASAFMTTTLQRPSFTPHVSVRVPSPVALATQNDCAVGGSGCASPVMRWYL